MDSPENRTVTRASGASSRAVLEQPSRTPGSRDRQVELLLVADTFHPAFSGAAIRFRRYLPGLLHRGVAVRILCGTPTAIKAQMMGIEPWWSGHATGRFLPEETLDGVPLHRLRLPDVKSLRRDYVFFRSLLHFCKARGHAVDAVQFLAVGLGAVPGLQSLRTLGLPTIAVGTMTAEPPSGFFTGGLKRSLLRMPWNLTDRVVVSTRAMRRYFRELGVRRPIEVIGNGVDLARFAPRHDGGRKRIRGELGIGEENPLLLYVGLVNRRKGVDLLLEAWTRLAGRQPEPHLVILGPRRDLADPEYADFHRKIESLITSSGARHRVHFLGTVSSVDEHMRAADLLVFPSRREGLGNVVLEAMATGLPVVLTPYVGRPSEIGRPGREYLLAQPDADSLAEVIVTLLDDPQLRARLGKAGRAWVERHADVEDSLDAYTHLYRDLVPRERRKNPGKMSSRERRGDRVRGGFS